MRRPRKRSAPRRVEAGPRRLPAGLVLVLALAASACATRGGLRPFATDGCSLFPDGRLLTRTEWRRCCVLHDMAYWRGGSAKERQAADAELRRCVGEVTGDEALAWTMYLGARAGGTAWLPTPFRWGFGWGSHGAYAPLTEGEQRRADELLQAWCAEHPEEPRPPWLDGEAPRMDR